MAEVLGRVKGLKGGRWNTKMHFYDYTYDVTGRATDLDEEESLYMANQPEYREEKIVSVSFYKTPLPVVLAVPLVEEKAWIMVHHFITFETSRLTKSGEIKTYYSVEKNQGSLTVQKSNCEEQVKMFLCGKPRERSASLLLETKGWRVPASLNDAVEYLSKIRAFSDKYNIWTGNCQHFAANMFKFLADNTVQYPSSMSNIVKYLENSINGPMATLESDDDQFSLTTGLVEANVFYGCAYEDQIKSTNDSKWISSYGVSAQKWNEGLVLFVEIGGKLFRLWRRNSAVDRLPHLVLTHRGFYADVDIIYPKNPPDSLDIFFRSEDPINHDLFIAYNLKSKRFSAILRFEFVEPLINSEKKKLESFYLGSLKNGPSDPSFLSSAREEFFISNSLSLPHIRRSLPHSLFSLGNRSNFIFYFCLKTTWYKVNEYSTFLDLDLD